MPEGKTKNQPQRHCYKPYEIEIVHQNEEEVFSKNIYSNRLQEQNQNVCKFISCQEKLACWRKSNQKYCLIKTNNLKSKVWINFFHVF